MLGVPSTSLIQIAMPVNRVVLLDAFHGVFSRDSMALLAIRPPSH
jgi:hypothetical protein